jgi:hypothetical protein
MAFKPRRDGTHPPLIWLDPNDPEGAAEQLMLAMYGTKERVAEVLAKHQKAYNPDDNDGKQNAHDTEEQHQMDVDSEKDEA